jgi:hypothetical protein
MVHHTYRTYYTVWRPYRTGTRMIWSLLPPANARRHWEERDGLVPDALLRRPTELDAMYKDYLHDVKIIHMGPSTYNDAMVKEKGVARCANARAIQIQLYRYGRPGYVLAVRYCTVYTVYTG